jgi:hypothetical protein
MSDYDYYYGPSPYDEATVQSGARGEMNEVLRELLQTNELPAVVRQMRAGVETVEQVMARAADEIEKLQRERDEARVALAEVIEEQLPDEFELQSLAEHWWKSWKNRNAAAIQAAREEK